MNLNELKLNRKARIIKIDLPYSIKERLHSMGIIKGVDITLRKTLPLGSPKIYEILNTSISIRNNTAKHIEINIRKKDS